MLECEKDVHMAIGIGCMVPRTLARLATTTTAPFCPARRFSLLSTSPARLSLGVLKHNPPIPARNCLALNVTRPALQVNWFPASRALSTNSAAAIMADVVVEAGEKRPAPEEEEKMEAESQEGNANDNKSETSATTAQSADGDGSKKQRTDNWYKQNPPGSSTRAPKRKIAMLLSFSGTNYQGMQRCVCV